MEKISEQKILYGYLKQNVGWLCFDYQGFLKNVTFGAGCTNFFFKLEFVMEKNSFLSFVKCHAIVNRIVKKYKQKQQYDLIIVSAKN